MAAHIDIIITITNSQNRFTRFKSLHKGNVWGFPLLFFFLWAKKVTLIQSVSFCFPLLGQSSVQQLVLTAFGDVTLAKLLTQSICEGEKQSDT